MRVETALNVLTAGIGIAVLALLLQRVWPNPDPVQPVDLPLAIDFAKAPRTVVVVFQRECVYCTESLPFYRRLIDTRNRRGAKVQIAVAAPERDAAIATYLAEQGVAADLVTHFNPGTLPVSVTPALLVAGSTGQLMTMWPGALSLNAEEQVLNYLFGN